MAPEVAAVWAIDIGDLRQFERAGYAKLKVTLIFCPRVKVATDRDFTAGENPNSQLNWTGNFSRKKKKKTAAVLRFIIALKKTFN